MRYLTWICFPDIHQIDMEKRQESALMAFVLFNVADEIVTDRNAGIAYQEGNNRGVSSLWETAVGSFPEKYRNLSGNPEKSKRSDRH